MRHPLNSPHPCSYYFWVKTWYSPHHLGQDYACNGAWVYAPCDGEIIKRFKGSQEGNCIWFRDKWGKIWRFMHLTNLPTITGWVTEGTPIGKTDNTGLSSAPHLHIDIWTNGIQMTTLKNTWNKNLLYDPEIYIKNRIKEGAIMKPNEILDSYNGRIKYHIKSMNELGEYPNYTLHDMIHPDSYIDSLGRVYGWYRDVEAVKKDFKGQFNPKKLPDTERLEVLETEKSALLLKLDTLEIENKDLKEKLSQKLADQDFIDNLKGMILSIINWVKSWYQK